MAGRPTSAAVPVRSSGGCRIWRRANGRATPSPRPEARMKAPNCTTDGAPRNPAPAAIRAAMPTSPNASVVVMISTAPSTAARISQMIQLSIAPPRKRESRFEIRPVRLPAHLPAVLYLATPWRRAGSLGVHGSGDALGRGSQVLVGNRWQHVFPDGQVHPCSFDHAERSWQEPHVEMRATVTPPVQVHAADLTERQDCPLDPAGNPAELRRIAGRHVSKRVEVLPTCKPHGARQAAADRRVQGPEVVVPERGRHRAAADGAWLSARLTPPRRFRYDQAARRPRHQR